MMGSILGGRISSYTACYDCQRNLHASGPYIGAIITIDVGVYTFLCERCAALRVARNGGEVVFK
jgi:hypothetical protein